MRRSSCVDGPTGVRDDPPVKARNRQRRGVLRLGDKSKYTDNQERKADQIAEGYEEKGVSTKEAERRAWAAVNSRRGGRQCLGRPQRHRAVSVGQEGCCHAQAQRRAPRPQLKRRRTQ